MNIKNVGGLTYSLPEVWLLQDTGIGTCELAARTAYNSFVNSEHEVIAEDFSNGTFNAESINQLNNIESSDLLDDLAWTYFHHSVLEHTNLTYLIKGTSRGVLQEHARHRIQSITVRSTRYTMSPIINAFIAEVLNNHSNTFPSEWFYTTLLQLGMFVTTDVVYNKLQIEDIWKKLKYQYTTLGHDAFMLLATTKDSRAAIGNRPSREVVFEILQSGKKKRNVGDAFKHIVNDNWKVDMVVTMNLRAYKNYLELRDSGAAYFQIQWLAQAMMTATPKKYLRLIVKTMRNSKD